MNNLTSAHWAEFFFYKCSEKKTKVLNGFIVSDVMTTDIVIAISK